MRWLVALFLALWPLSLSAQIYDLPALYDVTGVAADDVLNIRAAPVHTAEKRGELAPFRTGVEVLAFDEDRTWGMVADGEGSGWVALRYMARQPGQDTGEKLPVPMYCSGTEPFWSLEITAENVTFIDPGTDAPPLIMHRDPVPSLLHSPRGALVAGDITGFVTKEGCSDGMSDRPYGWSVDFFRTGNGGSYPFSGCCTQQF